ncbi:MAG: hypothetical protein ACFCVE_06905 [Phycisphaerae bacterium]
MLAVAALAVGLVGLVLSAVLGMAMPDGVEQVNRFYFAYLTAFAFFLTFPVGATFFLLVMHLFRAGWSVNVRRIAEATAVCFPLFLVLALPIILSVALQDGSLYRWAQAMPPEVVQAIEAPHAPGVTTFEQSLDLVHPDIPEGRGGAHGGVDHGQEAGPGGQIVPAPQEDRPNPEPNNGQSTGLRQDVPPGTFFAASDLSAPAHTLRFAAAVGPNIPEAEHGPAASLPEGLDAMALAKRAWLEPFFFVVRIFVYLAVLSSMGFFFWKNSVDQDETGDPAITSRLQRFSAPLTLVFGLTLTFMAFDLLMSLDHHWYSTIFGIYYFAGSAVGFFALAILTLMALQATGHLRQSVTVEHYHDLGKFLFAFVFFWGYIAFSQYMLLWYANVPESTAWLARRGTLTLPEVVEAQWGFTAVSLALLFGHLLIPFAGLLSRHVKRKKALLGFWAVWLVVFHFADIVWLVMPEFNRVADGVPATFTFGLTELAATVGVGGVFLGALVLVLKSHALRPLKDPRVAESMAFHNI